MKHSPEFCDCAVRMLSEMALDLKHLGWRPHNGSWTEWESFSGEVVAGIYQSWTAAMMIDRTRTWRPCTPQA